MESTGIVVIQISRPSSMSNSVQPMALLIRNASIVSQVAFITQCLDLVAWCQSFRHRLVSLCYTPFANSDDLAARADLEVEKKYS